MSRRSPTPRALAVLVLRDVQRGRGFSNRLLSERLERSPALDPRDRGLVTTLVYGVLRHRARLDVHLDAAARQPRKIRGVLRDILRVGAYELLELERPLRVAASEACKSAAALQPGGNLRGLITALLSRVQADGPPREADLTAAGDPRASLVQRWSIPPWIADRWLTRLGPEGALARASAVTRPPSVDLRVDLHRAELDEVEAALQAEIPDARIERASQRPGCLRVRGGRDLFFGPTHEAGLVSVMALGSQCAVPLLAPAPGERVLDACAGQGGKSAHIAEHMRRRGDLWLVEPEPARFEAQTEIIERCHLEVPELELSRHPCSLQDLDCPAGGFDAILVDAPCTGLGDLARHPELRWTRTEDDLHRHVAAQRDLLARACELAAPGGRVVWSVCSLEPEEGPALAASVQDLGWHVEREITITPETDDADGFFAALLRRTPAP